MRRVLPRPPQYCTPPPLIQPADCRRSPNSKTFVAAACEVCHARKTKCDGQRPRCGSCIQRGADCKYVTVGKESRSQAKKRKFEELQNNEQGYKKLFSILATLPAGAAQDVFRRIRSGQNVQAVLRHIKDADLLMQMSLVPDVRLRYDFPYINQMPLFLLVPGNQYLESCIFRAAFTNTEASALESGTLSAREMGPSAYTIPYHASSLLEPLIKMITAAGWTVVDVTNDMVRKLLEGYFRYQYPYFAPFNKDLFLEDMAKGRPQLCSSLLVNAVLAAACQTVPELTDRAKFWRPSTFQYQFLAETRRLLELEAGRPSLTTIQALLVMNLTANMNGLDKVGSAYLLQAVNMAYEMNLFHASADVESSRMRKARVCTAWSLFIWQTQQCFYFYHPPFFKHPPDYPLPNPDGDTRWYGELWLQYPGSLSPLPSNLGHTIKAIADFRIIQNSLGYRLYTRDQSRPEYNLQEAYRFRASLRNWYTGLPDCLTPAKIVFPAQLKIHMEYHTSIINLFRPFEKHTSDPEENQVERPESRDSPEAIITLSQIALETLVRIYYMRHGWDSYDSMFIYFLPFTFHMTMNRLLSTDSVGIASSDQEAVRSTLVLIAKGMHSHSMNHILSALVYRALKNLMRPQDRDILHAYTATCDVDETELATATIVQAEYPVPIIQINENPEAARVKNLVKLYQHLHVANDSETDPDRTP